MLFLYALLALFGGSPASDDEPGFTPEDRRRALLAYRLHEIATDPGRSEQERTRQSIQAIAVEERERLQAEAQARFDAYQPQTHPTEDLEPRGMVSRGSVVLRAHGKRYTVDNSNYVEALRIKEETVMQLHREYRQAVAMHLDIREDHKNLLIARFPDDNMTTEDRLQHYAEADSNYRASLRNMFSMRSQYDALDRQFVQSDRLMMMGSEMNLESGVEMDIVFSTYDMHYCKIIPEHSDRVNKDSFYCYRSGYLEVIPERPGHCFDFLPSLVEVTDDDWKIMERLNEREPMLYGSVFYDRLFAGREIV